MISLRPDQTDLRVKLRVALRQSSAVLAFAPTGFGKTCLAAELIRILTAAGKSVIFCVHRLALLKQTAVTLDGFGVPFSYIAAGYHHNVYRKVNIASIDTLKNRLGKYPADFVFVDEAHLSASAGWAAVVEHYKSTGAKIIGLSGSPIRLDGKPLGDVWDAMVEGPSVRWLIDNGHLSKYRAFSPAGIDLSSLHTRGGEYVQSEVEDLIAGKAVMSGAVRHWRKYAAGKRTIAFAPSIKRSQELAAEFQANGLMFVALDANTPQADRDVAFNALADRQLDGLINVNLFSEGFDMGAQVGRDVPIECVLDLSPTQSLARHLQKHGRGLRRKPEPAVLLDLVGGFARLGLPDEEREWSLDGVRNGASRKKQEEHVRQCPACYAAHEPAPRCPECGHVYVVEGRRVSEVDGELAEIDVEAVRAARKRQHEADARALADKIKAGADLGDPKIKAEVEYLMKTVTAKRSKTPAKWIAHVITARLAKRQGATG